MKKYILILNTLFLSFFLLSCGVSSNFVNVSMPNFKPQINTQVKIPDSNIKIALDPILIERNNNYSDYFENSVLKIRLDKEIELLKENLEEQIKTIVQLKNYEISQENADYKLESVVKIYIDEQNVKKSEQWLGGESVSSNLGLSFLGKIALIDLHNPQNTTKITSETKLDSLINLLYPIKSAQGMSLFKTSLSTVPTQLNKGLEIPAFELDKSFLSFYKNTLETLYKNLPQAQLSSNNKEQNFNEFQNEELLEELPKENLNSENSNTDLEEKENETINDDGVIIFE